MTLKNIGWLCLAAATGCASFLLGQHRKAVEPIESIPRQSTPLQSEELSGLEDKPPGKAEGELIEEALYSLQAREPAFQELEQRYHRQTDKLIEIAGEQDGPPMTRYYAFRLLGLYRAPQAIQVLVKNLDFDYPGVATEASYFTRYPAAEALTQFGHEGGIAVLNYLVRDSAKPATDEMLRHRSFVLESTFPRESRPWQGDDGVGVVERYIERIPPQWTEGKRNVERLLEMLKKPPKDR